MKLMIVLLMVVMVMVAWAMAGSAQVWECPFDAYTCETVWYPNETAAVCVIPTIGYGDDYEEWCSPPDVIMMTATATMAAPVYVTPTMTAYAIPLEQQWNNGFRFEINPFRFNR